MADNPPKRQQNFTEYLKVEASLVERREKLFEALSAFVTQQGGWVVSPPGAKYLRIEILKNSPLPARLLEVGYSVRAAGSTTRIALGNFAPVDIISVTLGK